MAMVLVSMTGWLFASSFTKSHLLSLCLLNVLIGGFGLLILLLPIGHRMPALPPMLFAASWTHFLF
jgi:hypothetical protein